MSKPAPSKKSQGRRRSRNKQPPTKVIIRHLPPNLTEESFCQTIDLPLDSYWYLTGPVSTDLGYFATSRAYITFNDMNDLLLFKDKYDGYVFVDTKGGEYRAQVDLAPFQKVPRQKKNRKHSKVATLEKDADYLKFVESLNAPKSESNVNTAEMYLEELEHREKELKLSNGCPKVTTPLIEFILKKKKSERSKKKYDEPRMQEDNKHRRIYTRTHRAKNDRIKSQKKPSQQNDGQSALVKKQLGNSAVSNGSAKSTESKSKKERTFEKQPGNSSTNNGTVKSTESKPKKDRPFDKQPGNSCANNGPAKTSDSSKGKKDRSFEKKDFGDKVKRDRRRNRNRDRDREKDGKGDPQQVTKPVKLLKKGESQAAI